MSEPQLLEARPTRARYGVIAFAVAVAVITYADRIAISQAAPFLQRELGLSTVQMGLAFSCFFWSYALFEIPGGWLADRVGARKALTRVVVAWSIFTMATGWVGGFASLLVVRLLFGAGEAGCFPGVTRAFSDWLPAGERARAQGILWLAARWGGAFTPILVAGLMAHLSWRRVFELFGAVGILWAVLFYRWYRDRPEEHRGVNRAELALLAGRSPDAGHTAVPWAALLRNRTVLLLSVQYMGINFAWPFYITWLPTYLRESRGLDGARSAILAGLPLFLGGIGCLVAGLAARPLSRLLGSAVWARRLPPMIGCSAAGVCWIISPTVADPTAAMVVLALASFFHDLLMPSAWATCMDVGGRHAGVVSGSMNMMGNVMAGFAPMIVGLILTFTNRNWTVNFTLAGALYVVSTLAWAFIDPRDRLEDGRAPQRAASAAG